ncbi:unnamed protein product [Lampetra planeri]
MREHQEVGGTFYSDPLPTTVKTATIDRNFNNLRHGERQRDNNNHHHQRPLNQRNNWPLSPRRTEGHKEVNVSSAGPFTVTTPVKDNACHGEETRVGIVVAKAVEGGLGEQEEEVRRREMLGTKRPSTKQQQQRQRHSWPLGGQGSASVTL